MRQKTLLGLFFLLSLLKVGAQSQPILFDKKNTVPTSPEAALLGRFGDIPIGYYTGTANISIPLYTIKEGGVTIPIVLQYHSSGIKVADEATWVGLGWSLEPEGTISQSVIGKEDDQDYMVSRPGYSYLHSRGLEGNYSEATEVGTNSWDCSLPPDVICMLLIDHTGDDAAAINALVDGHGEPDMYQFNFGGYSGKFYINPETHAIVQIDKKAEIKFEKSAGHFIATTVDGDKFYFNTAESLSGTAPGGGEMVGYTWKLDYVTLANGKSINFTYTSLPYSASTTSSQYHDGFQLGFGESYSTTVTLTSNTVKTLTTITTADVIVDFNLESREDNVLKRLKSLDIRSAITGAKIKSYNFAYSYFPFDITYGDNGTLYTGLDFPDQDKKGKRLKLDNVQEVGYTSPTTTVTNPPYQFSYDMSVTLPLKTSFAVDYWGYYNGTQNTSLVPDLRYFYYSGNGGTNRPTSPIGGGDRIPDPTKISAGMLNKITYPTGGFTEFTYESNSFTNYQSPDRQKLNSSTKLAILKSTNTPAIDITSYQFTLPKTTIVRFTNQIGNGYPVQTPAPLTLAEMMGSKITLVKANLPGGVGTTPVLTTLKTWDLTSTLDVDFTNNHGKIWEEDLVVNFDPDPLCYFVVTASMASSIPSQNSSTKIAYVSSRLTYYDDRGVDMATGYQCGARVSAIKNYTDAGKIASYKKINYVKTDGTSSGKLMVPLVLLYDRPMWFAKQEGELCEGVSHRNDPAIRYISSENFAGGNSVGYSRVEEIEIAPDNTINGKTVYNYINETSQWKINNPAVPYLKNGLISSEEIFNSAGSLLQTNTYTYKNLSTAVTFTGMKIFSSWVGLDQCSPGDIHLTMYPAHKYRIHWYPINSEWNVPATKTTIQNDGLGHSVSQLESYDYNSYGQMKSITTSDSKGQSLVTNYLYPADDASAQATLLKSVSHYSSIMQHSTVVAGGETKKDIIGYSTFTTSGSSVIAKSFINESFNQRPSFTNTYFNKYDDKGNLLEFIQRAVVSAQIFSDNKSYVIAQVDNANFEDIDFTSFELNETGGWTFSGTPLADGSAPTGKKVYSLAGTLSKSGLTTSKLYNISYWRNSAAGPYTITGTQSTVTGRTVNGWTNYQHVVTGVTTASITGSGLIDEVRLCPDKSFMTSYTYEPLVGITSKTDINNTISYFEYDAFGRLNLVRDQDKNILKRFCYNYSGQPIDCPVPVSVPTTCPAGSQMLTYSNVSNIGSYVAVYTNTVSPFSVYTFPIPNGTGNLGCIPDGTYNLTVSKTGGGISPVLIITSAGTTVSGTSATFNNIKIGSNSLKSSKKITIDYDL